MKKYLIYSFLTLFCTALFFQSCKKDDAKPEKTPETSTKTSTKTEPIEDVNGVVIGSKTTTTTTTNGQTTTEVVIKDVDGNEINTDTKFTITFNTNGAKGTAPSTLTGGFGDNVTLPGQGDMTFGDYDFIGWNTKSDRTGTAYNANGKITLTKNITLYATWGINYVYAVIFDTNGATDGEYTDCLWIKDKDFKEFELPTTSLVKGDLVFKGWSTSATGSKIFPAGVKIKDGDSDFSDFKTWLTATATILTQNTATLYAVYGTPESAKTSSKYNIVFNSNGYEGSLPESIGFDDFRTATFKFPTNTFSAPNEYEFVGWSTEKTYETGGVVVNSGIKFYYSENETWSYIGDDNYLNDAVSTHFYEAEKWPTLNTPEVTIYPIFAKKTGTLTLQNTSGITYTISVDGKAVGYLDNDKSYDIADLSLNEKHEVIIHKYDKENKVYYPATKVTHSFTFTKPGEKQTFKFPKVGTLSIEHNSKNTYYVYIDGEKVATWTKAGTYTFDVSAGIEHTVKVVQQDGYLLNPTQGTKKFTVQEGKIISFSGPVSGSSTSYFN